MDQLLYRGAKYVKVAEVYSVDFISEKDAMRLQPSPLYGMISITDPGHVAYLQEGWGALLRLQFDDVEEYYDDEFSPYRSKHQVFAPWQARKIINWLNDNKHKLSGIYVHCWAGISRSAAVAKFIAEKLGVPFDETYDRYNTLVYDTLRAVDAGMSQSSA